MVRWWQLPPHPLDPVRVARAASRPPPPCLPGLFAIPTCRACHSIMPTAHAILAGVVGLG
jgi:hypothetical protein